MFQRSGVNSEEIRQLDAVATPAPRPLEEELRADMTRAELASEYSKEAIASTLNVNALSAENFISQSEEVIGSQINRIASLLLGADERNAESEQESAMVRGAMVQARAEETAQNDLGSKVSLREAERISVAAGQEAQTDYSFSTDILSRLNAATQNPEKIDQPTISPSRPLGGKVVTINLATSDFPLSEVYGPGFEMLARDQSSAAQRDASGKGLAVNRATTRDAIDYASIDYAAADLSQLSLGMPRGVANNATNDSLLANSSLGSDARSFRIAAAREEALLIGDATRATAA
jgi:hypothetical protein